MTAEVTGGGPQKPTVLFVLGMARSGTSALTRVLSLSGGSLPPGMVGSSGANPSGFWESRKVIHLNLAILRRLGNPFFDPSPLMQREGAIGAEARAIGVGEIAEFFETLPAVPLVVIKEPSITALSAMWFEAARLAGFDVVNVIAVRHPGEVTASLGKIGTKASPELASALWLKYNLLGERDTRGVPRVFVDYANLLNDWRHEVQRISASLAIDLSTRDEDAIDAFLERGLHTQRHGGPVTENFGADWISVVYGALSAAARDEPWDASELDRVFEAYRASEEGFREVFNEVRRLRKLDKVIGGPLLTRLALEAVAVVHRRKGAWA